MNNISIVRNPDTLEILGFTPIYDSGNSMFYNISIRASGSIRIDEIKDTFFLFLKKYGFLSYVKDRNIVNIVWILKKDLIERHMRIPRLQALYEKKLTKLRAFQMVKTWKNR